MCHCGALCALWWLVVACGGLWCVQVQVRCIERSTEGLHSIVKRTLGRSPAASLSYLSLDLRFSQLVHTAIVETRLVQHAMDNVYSSLSSLAGLRDAIVKILGLGNLPLLRDLKDRQLADLLYRDNLSLKHSASSRVQQAVEELLKNSADSGESLSGQRRASDVLSSALVDFLVEAYRPHKVVFHFPSMWFWQFWNLDLEPSWKLEVGIFCNYIRDTWDNLGVLGVLSSVVHS